MNKILTGLLLGIGIGLLLAPDKGSETLRKLKGKVNDLKDQARDGVDDLADSANDAINTARSKAKKALH